MKALVLILLCGLIQACANDSSEGRGETAPVDSAELVLNTSYQADSLAFRLHHHYTINTNMQVVADSLVLMPRFDDDWGRDTALLLQGDYLAVADVRRVEGDSLAEDTIWIKVAGMRQRMGWVPEQLLLSSTVPDEAISKILYSLTGSRAVWMTLLVVLGAVGFVAVRMLGRSRLRSVRFYDLYSFYPILLLLLVAVLGVTYASVQNFVPEFWQEYYFHPTLSPIGLPWIMALLVVIVWAIVIVSVAVGIEVYNHFYFLPGMMYLLEIGGMAMMTYIAFSWATLVYVGYVLLPLFVAVLLWLYFRRLRGAFACAQCGHRLRGKGVCPHCGTENA